MFCTQFPNLQWLKQQAEQRFSNRRSADGAVLDHAGWPTVLLNVRSGAIFRDNIPGPFSLFSNVSGSSIVRLDGHSTEVPTGFFFLTNGGQRYSLEVEERRKAETFNIHFGEHWAEEVFVALAEKPETLIERPALAREINVSFYNKLFREDTTVQLLRQQLIRTAAEDMLLRDQLLFQLVSHLLKENRNVRLQANSIAATKVSTRGEILKRLHLATDYIYSAYAREISLEDIAQHCMLSKFHFMRLFKEVYGQTPHQFITALRIQKAKELLITTPAEVSEIGRSVGFRNSSSFSRLFFNSTGIYPTTWRSASN